MNTNILLAEDDQNLGFVTSDSLEQAGYQVQWAKNGEEALRKFNQDDIDLCILDIMMPNMDGFSLARAIRDTDLQVPIIFLTARNQEEDKLKGFEIGGDDYVVKPFSVRELVHRIEVFIRRSTSSPEVKAKLETYNLGSYSFDERNLKLRKESYVQRLTRMEADLLKILWESRNELVTRSDILIKIWGEDDYFKGRSLDVFISRLRKYLQLDDSISIKNHHGVGFTLISPQ